MISPADWKRVDALLTEALDAEEGEEREALLSRSEALDPDTAVEVRRLLASLDAAESTLAETADRLVQDLLPHLANVVSGLASEGEPTLPPGTRLGPWEVGKRIGRGGMADVHRAERADGAFQTQVALKVLRRGIDTVDVVERFRAERQILAGLTHPGIARLLDGGVTDDGRPFLVMEYVDGQPITNWCVEKEVPFPGRVGLLVEVCRAVEAAHRALVVHRDLKPSNILVTTDGSPKLLDFGIAKIVSPWEGGGSPLTRTGARLLTPSHAAPEQLRGLLVTTATDVYGLGLVLYELLANRPAFDLKGLAPSEAEARVLRGEPTPPLTALGHRSQLARDLDAITHQALATEPQDRYGDVAGLRRDLEAALAGRSIQARRLGAFQQAGRWLRRNTLPAAGGTALLFLAAGWSVSTAVQRSQLQTALIQVESERAVAEEVATFVEGLFSAGQSTFAGERQDTLPVGTFLREAAAGLRSDVQRDPTVQGRLLSLLGGFQERVGRREEAVELLEEALAIQRGGDVSLEDVARTLSRLGTGYQNLGRLDQAEEVRREELGIRRDLAPQGDRETAGALGNLGAVLQDRGDLEGARALLDQAVAIAAGLTPPDTATLLRLLNPRSVLAFRMGDLPGAIAGFQQISGIHEESLGPDHPVVGRELQNLGFLQLTAGDAESALPNLERGLAILERAMGEAHPQVAATRGNYARALATVGRRDEAEAAFQKAVEDLRAAGPIPPLANLLGTWASWLQNEGRPEEALEAFQEAVAVFHGLGPAFRRQSGEVSVDLGRALCGAQRVEEGRSAMAAAIELLEGMDTPDSRRIQEAARAALEGACRL